MTAHRREDRALLSARLAAQQLSTGRAASALEATRHLLAIQAQDARAARLAIRARTRGGHSSDVDHALSAERSVVITWVNRGTLHLVAAEDEPLLHALTTPQLRTGSARRLGQEGVTPAATARGLAAIRRALAHGPMTREQVRVVLQQADVPVAGQALVHVLFRATLDGLIVRGPLVGAEHAFVLRDDWLGARPAVDRDRALAELARRYLAAHGPADERDLAKWAQLTLRDARAAFAAIARELVEWPHGRVALRRAQNRERDAPPGLPPPRLLGPFDPVLLGWRSRDLILDGAREAVTTNGIIRAIALVDGRAVGTWTLPRGRVALNLWGSPDAATVAALQREAGAVHAYLSPRQPGGG